MTCKLQNVSSSFREMADDIAMKDGSLPAFAWPGGYQMFYFDAENNILCPDCANKNDEYSSPLEAYDINYEDESLFCAQCSSRIPAAYE